MRLLVREWEIKFWTFLVLMTVLGAVVFGLSSCGTVGYISSDNSLNNMDNMPRLAEQLEKQKEFY